MLCPKCGKENPEGAQVCSGCGSPLPGSSAPAEQPITKTSGLAIAAFVLGILSPFTLAITAIPAVVLGIISLVKIEKSGGRLTGIAFAVIGITIPLVAFLVMISYALLRTTGGGAYRMTCGSNLSSIGKAMLIYANDYDGKLPRAGGRGTIWQPKINNWQASDRITAYNLQPDGSGGAASISASFYLLIKYSEISAKPFVCTHDKGTTEFKAAEYGVRDKELIDLWDFGPDPWKHCSYAYHIPTGYTP